MCDDSVGVYPVLSTIGDLQTVWDELYFTAGVRVLLQDFNTAMVTGMNMDWHNSKKRSKTRSTATEDSGTTGEGANDPFVDLADPTEDNDARGDSDSGQSPSEAE